MSISDYFWAQAHVHEPRPMYMYLHSWVSVLHGWVSVLQSRKPNIRISENPKVPPPLLTAPFGIGSRNTPSVKVQIGWPMGRARAQAQNVRPSI